VSFFITSKWCKLLFQVAYWSDDAFYYEHRFLSKFKNMDDFVYCIMLVKFSIVNNTPESLLKVFLKQDEAPKPPEPSEELLHFINYNQTSSQALKAYKAN